MSDNTETDTDAGIDMTAEAYRLSLGLSAGSLAEQLGVDTSRVLAWEQGNEPVPEKAMAWLGEHRAELVDEIRSFMADEQEMRRNGESDPETGGWDFTLYRDAPRFAAANQPTRITDWRTWNQAYLIIGLLIEALGYQINYRTFGYRNKKDNNRMLVDGFGPVKLI
ncbi:helix-turn-helix transcriptional regulator [Bifidobacterium sp. ESL0690]|uniref:helix-turn-helix transcriptional regulator n=1 Tax=Bifidobacterium sp. ESL0690 TaxID=2983214 RepID=UPI0023F9F94E|nr:helix-turn-helix transcriptional regulator [Bifidobacterium sp. ESL0690]WEV47648.1 helix-turn-helix transcriptional regulator [Bifidobacterium sp. ESL0690]